MQQLDEPFRDKDIFDNLSFFNSSDLTFESKSFFLQFLDNILPWDLDLGSQNVADPTDPETDQNNRLMSMFIPTG